MLAAEGARVAVVARAQRYIDRAVTAITTSGGEAIGISADMSSQEGIDSAVATDRERARHRAQAARTQDTPLS